LALVRRGELGCVIGNAAGNSCAGAIVRIGINRIHEPRHVANALTRGPAVVRAARPPVHLFPGILADVIDKDQASSRLYGESEWIAQPKRPDGSIVPGSCGVERIVGRDRSVRIDPKQLAELVAKGLRVARSPIV